MFIAIHDKNINRTKTVYCNNKKIAFVNNLKINNVYFIIYLP